jgi:hypothetical protein
MTAAEEAKKAGYQSLKQLSELSGKTPECLRDWQKYNRKLFEAVLKGFQDNIKRPAK